MTAQELKDKFDSDLKQLQETCNHEDISGWLNLEWAPAHYAGVKVKVCNVCWKHIERKEDPPITYEVMSQKSA